MNRPISKICKVLCASALLALLFACGSGKTVDPYKPTRVIGLGDAHNDMSGTQKTVSVTTGEVKTVVGQVAALWGVASVNSDRVASSDKTIADLNSQVNGLGALSSSDLMVITTGNYEFKHRGGPGSVATTAAANAYLTSLKAALDTLKAKGANHILITSVVDTSTDVNSDFAKDVVTFNSVVSAGLGQYADVARLANIDRPQATFPNWGTNTNSPYCGVGTPAPCAVGAQDPGLYFLADDTADSLNPTPAGNRWIAQYLYNVTSQGWR